MEHQVVKPVRVDLPAQAWEAVLNVISQSNAPYQQVVQVQNLIIGQLNARVQEAREAEAKAAAEAAAAETPPVVEEPLVAQEQEVLKPKRATK